jgi:hypothetical protein
MRAPIYISNIVARKPISSIKVGAGPSSASCGLTALSKRMLGVRASPAGHRPIGGIHVDQKIVID